MNSGLFRRNSVTLTKTAYLRHSYKMNSNNQYFYPLTTSKI